MADPIDTDNDGVDFDRRDQPELSVIIPTSNRRELLRQTIVSFFQLTVPPSCFEVIIVDDGSTDGTEGMVHDLHARAAFPLRYCRMAKNGGPVLARNHGARFARAGILAFTDSDCQATPLWVATALAAFKKDAGLGFVAGPAINRPGQRVRFFSIGGAECTGEHYTYPAANVIYRADVFWKVGGFDPTAWVCNVGATPLDFNDTDLAWRIREIGYRHGFLQDMVVHHEVHKLSPWEWLLHYTRLTTIPELVRRHPSFGNVFLWRRPFRLAENPLFYLAIVGLLLLVLLKSSWFLLFAALFLIRMIWLLSRSHTMHMRRLPLLLPQVLFLCLRQTVVCGSLIYGSVRSRTIVL